MQKAVKGLGFLIKAEVLLIAGGLFALLWANGLLTNINSDLTLENYQNVKHYVLWENPWIGHEPHAHEEAEEHAKAHESSDHEVNTGGLRQLTFAFLVLDILFPFFFAFAAIEIFEELMPGGALSDPKKAVVPIAATIGGIVFPIGFYLGAAYFFGKYNELFPGWLVCTATDIAFASIAAVGCFGSKHPAKAFIMVIAVVDDGIGLINIAVFLNQGELHWNWMLLVLWACLATHVMKKSGVMTWYWYLIPMFASWYGFYATGFHPSLGFVPVVFCMPPPPAKVGAGLFDDAVETHHRTDPLGVFEHKLEVFVAFILGAFGFVNAGIVWTGLQPESIVTLIGIIAGKVIGITFFGCIAAYFVGLPKGLRMWHIPMIGLVCAIAFTVGMFVTVLSPFATPALRDGVMMGCVMSVLLVPVCIVVGRVLRIRRINTEAELQAS